MIQRNISQHFPRTTFAAYAKKQKPFLTVGLLLGIKDVKCSSYALPAWPYAFAAFVRTNARFNCGRELKVAALVQNSFALAMSPLPW